MPNRLTPVTHEVHRKVTSVVLSAQDLRDIVIDGLRARGVSCDGYVVITYYGIGTGNIRSDGSIGMGPKADVTIEKDMSEPR